MELQKKRRKNDAFPAIETLLKFILYYMKTNPLHQTQAAALNLNQPLPNLWLLLLKNTEYHFVKG
ncbi:MAG: hypothetical protein Q8904_12755 [Bacteroidota bacterium]|nr:hypothetical protein [Bacteroidota bacterium]